MSLQRLMPWLVALLVASAGLMLWATTREARPVAAAAAFGFVSAMVAVGIWVNRQAMRDPGREPRASFHMLRRNTRLVALIYAWGASAMLAVYVVGDLKWRHGWQYGAAMALIAALLLWLVDRLGRPGNWLSSPEGIRLLASAAPLHGLAAAGGLVFLVMSGKLSTPKGDWAANLVFLAGGLGIVAFAELTARTHRRLSSLDRDGP